MRCLLTVILAVFVLFSHAQSLTGTWLGTYFRDQPGNKRLFYYRLYLRQSADSLYGLCETLDAQADIKNISPDHAGVLARQTVYNHHFSAPDDSTAFELFTGTTLETGTGHMAAAGNSPAFLSLHCKVTPKENFQRPGTQLLYSALPASDGTVGVLSVKKISDSIPDLSAFTAGYPSFAGKGLGLKITLPGFLRRKAKKEPVVKTSPADTVLPLTQRTGDIQAVIETASDLARIDLYDNGEVDNDTVSLYLNGKPLLLQKRLSTQPLQLEVKLEPGTENAFLLFAHNLGDIAPNTALLVVTTGTDRHLVSLSGSLQKNALVILKVAKASPPD